MTTAPIVTSEQLRTSPNGCDCVFVIVGNAGMKCYVDKDFRDRFYRMQRWFALRGLAPDAWFCFDFIGPDGDTLYAYYSEIAEVKGKDNWREYSAWANELSKELDSEHGIYWGDNHSGNVGRINGKTVIIDFGYMKGDCIDDILK
jgi:hypothetical protein